MGAGTAMFFVAGTCGLPAAEWIAHGFFTPEAWVSMDAMRQWEWPRPFAAEPDESAPSLSRADAGSPTEALSDPEAPPSPQRSAPKSEHPPNEPPVHSPDPDGATPTLDASSSASAATETSGGKVVYLSGPPPGTEWVLARPSETCARCAGEGAGGDSVDRAEALHPSAGRGPQDSATVEESASVPVVPPSNLVRTPGPYADRRVPRTRRR